MVQSLVTPNKVVDEPPPAPTTEAQSVLLRNLCTLVAETLPSLRPVVPQTQIHGLDSMAVGRLAYAIKSRMVNPTIVRVFFYPQRFAHAAGLAMELNCLMDGYPKDFATFRFAHGL